MLVGRVAEQKSLDRIYRSQEAEFLVVYGRRRVGKTFLIKQYFAKKKCTFFQATGLHKGDLAQQLNYFITAVSASFYANVPLRQPENWDEAFKILHANIANLKGKVVLFFDELPWMLTPRSGLLGVIDYYWNQYWCGMPNLVLIICGSSASWLIKKIIYNKGGLHNRVTCHIRLAPFLLYEVEAYLKSKKIKLNRQHILEIYMATGGIPYYLRYAEPGQTAAQTIQKLFFEKGAPLHDEFNKLFNSLFNDAPRYIELVNLIGQKKQGLKGSMLKKMTTLSSSGGSLSARLKDLCETGFIEEYIPWGKVKGEYYKVIDEYCLFYIHWLKKGRFATDNWLQISHSPAYFAWSGYAFEAVCMKHINQILQALHINMPTKIGAWQFSPSKNLDEDGAQLDLIIDRKDGAMNICEIKHSQAPFVIDKKEALALNKKVTILEKRRKSTSKFSFL